MPRGYNRKHPLVECDICHKSFSSLYIGAHKNKIHGYYVRQERNDRIKARPEPKEIPVPEIKFVETPFPTMSVEEKVAHAIVDTVIHRAQNPVIKYVDNPRLIENIDKLQKVIFDLNEENEQLKKKISAFGSTRITHNGLKQTVRDFLSNEDWEKLMKETPRNG